MIRQLIETSLLLAQKKMRNIGFSDEQIEQLLTTGRRDLENEFEHLRRLVEDGGDEEALNRSLHALKGLLLNMGNESLASKFIELRANEDIEQKRNYLRQMLFDSK